MKLLCKYSRRHAPPNDSTHTYTYTYTLTHTHITVLYTVSLLYITVIIYHHHHNHHHEWEGETTYPRYSTCVYGPIRPIRFFRVRWSLSACPLRVSITRRIVRPGPHTRDAVRSVVSMCYGAIYYIIILLQTGSSRRTSRRKSVT